jgi:hypothetical protein
LIKGRRLPLLVLVVVQRALEAVVEVGVVVRLLVVGVL